MSHVGVIRPNETGRIATNPGFRRMHQVIEHDGRCRRVKAWKVELLEQNSDWISLEAYAQSKPSLADLKALADTLAKKYVAKSKMIRELRKRPSARRDAQYENALLVNQYYLLYEELVYAMNVGDIGRVEMCFEAWVPIFKATGKHKYATALMKHVTDVHYFFPEGLK